MRKILSLLFLAVMASAVSAAELGVSDLVGTWTGKSADGLKGTCVFQNDATCVWSQEDPSAQSSPVQGTYSVIRGDPIWRVTIKLSGNTDLNHLGENGIVLQGILQPISFNKIKMEVTAPGTPIKTFSSQAVIYTRSQ